MLGHHMEYDEKAVSTPPRAAHDAKWFKSNALCRTAVVGEGKHRTPAGTSQKGFFFNKSGLFNTVFAPSSALICKRTPKLINSLGILQHDRA